MLFSRQTVGNVASDCLNRSPNRVGATSGSVTMLDAFDCYFHMMDLGDQSPNQTLETNCRPAFPLDAGRHFGRAIHARPCVSGGSRSALR